MWASLPADQADAVARSQFESPQKKWIQKATTPQESPKTAVIERKVGDYQKSDQDQDYSKSL
jgi:hypothetical protein